MTLLGYLKTSDPTLTQHEDKHSFVECATFADDIKYHAGGWQGDFHFIDQPFIEEGKESDYKISKNAHTLTQGIQDITDWLSGKNGKGYEKSYIFDFIQNRLYPDKPDLAKSYALRLLIHYVGDMVQPFHAESRYNSANPSGDKGANGFPLPNHYEVKELHALIDKVLYVEHTNISRPLSESDWNSFVTKTAEYQKKFEKICCSKATVWDNQDFTAWQVESFNIAKTLYSGLTEN